eukprot:jgi/Botrbrau1/9720/Bobra.0388s0013.1
MYFCWMPDGAGGLCFQAWPDIWPQPFGPGRWSPDYIIAVCDEAAQRREARRGKIPRHFMDAPSPTNFSWEKMWYAHLLRKRWTRDRLGNGWVRHP